MNTTQHIVGMEITNITTEYGAISQYVDFETLELHIMDYRYDLTVNEFFDMACQHLEDFDSDVESTDDAKITQTYYA